MTSTLTGEPRTQRLHDLAAAQRSIELARDRDGYMSAVAERAAVEMELVPLTEQDCILVDRRLRTLRAADRRTATERAAA